VCPAGCLVVQLALAIVRVQLELYLLLLLLLLQQEVVATMVRGAAVHPCLLLHRVVAGQPPLAAAGVRVVLLQVAVMAMGVLAAVARVLRLLLAVAALVLPLPAGMVTELLAAARLALGSKEVEEAQSSQGVRVTRSMVVVDGVHNLPWQHPQPLLARECAPGMQKGCPLLQRFPRAHVLQHQHLEEVHPQHNGHLDW